MNPYHKIKTVWSRDPDNNFKTLIEGEYSRPEFRFLRNVPWLFTEKVDGTNIRVIWQPEIMNVEFRGRSDNAQIPAKLFTTLNLLFREDKMFDAFSDQEVCLYGEGFGAGIQKVGKLYKDYQDFVLFDVRIGDLWLNRANVVEVAYNLGIPVVPAVGQGTLEEAVKLVSNGFKSQWGDFQAEGIVARPSVELLDRRGNRIITKIKCKDFS